MNKFDSKNEAIRNLERISNFLKNAKDTKCEWGSLIQGICQKMRAFNINYSVKVSAPKVIEYEYRDNFNNALIGVIVL